MAEIYRVAVQRVVRTLNENGAEVDRDYVSVIEFEAPADSLLRFAPAEVAVALGAPGIAVTVMPERETVPGDAEADSYPQDVPEATGSGESARPTRKRRTKAEKAADDAAQAEGYRDAAHKAEVLAMAEADRAKDGDGPTGDGDADLAAAAAGLPVAVDDGVPNGVAVMGVPAATPAPVADSAPQGEATPAAPWNPFTS